MQESKECQLRPFVKNSPCSEGNSRSASLCSTSYGNQRPNTICSRVLFLSHSSSLASVWTVSCNLYVGLQSDIFPSGFPVNIFCAYLLHLQSPLDYKWLRSERFLRGATYPQHSIVQMDQILSRYFQFSFWRVFR